MNPAWKNKNLRLYFSGQIVSQVGTWMQQMALSWLIYRLTNSPLMLGAMAFVTQVPCLLLTPFAGIIADRTNRHRLLVITQALAMLQAALLTALVWTGKEQLWQLMVLSGALGMIMAFEVPTRQSFIVDMLDDKSQLPSAIGANSSITTLTRLVGPFGAGLLVAWAGERVCFLINALSYIAVIAALLLLKTNQRIPVDSKKSGLAQLKEGFLYTTSFTPIRDLIFLLAMVGLFAMPFAILMPAFAKDVFHGNASTLGFLTAASSAGSVIAALFLTSRKGPQELSRWIILGCGICGLSLIAFGACSYLPMSLLAVTVVGFGTMIVMAGSLTLIQTIVDEDKRGRVMSFVVMAFLGFGPFGSMVAGGLANAIGAGKTVMLTGSFTLVLALIFARRIMSIHLKVMPPEVLRAVEDAAEAESEITVMTK